MSRWLVKETGEDVAALGGFSILLADSCWKYGSGPGTRGSADKHYDTMTLAELCLLPVEKLAAPDAALFMWATWPLMLEAYALMKAWGFEYKNCGFVWAKTNKLQLTPFVGMGHMTRGNTEFCLLGTRGKPKRIDAAVQQLILDDMIVAPVGEHSEKPPETRDRIIRLLGDDQPAVELFARQPAPGWHCWGNEVESTVTLEP